MSKKKPNNGQTKREVGNLDNELMDTALLCASGELALDAIDYVRNRHTSNLEIAAQLRLCPVEKLANAVVRNVQAALEQDAFLSKVSTAKWVTDSVRQQVKVMGALAAELDEVLSTAAHQGAGQYLVDFVGCLSFDLRPFGFDVHGMGAFPTRADAIEAARKLSAAQPEVVSLWRANCLGDAYFREALVAKAETGNILP